MAEKFRTYKLKTYINASHAVRWESGTGERHNHTWEIITELHTLDKMVAFYDIEKDLQAAFSDLSGAYLNELPEFAEINPTVENVTEYLFTTVDELLHAKGAELLRIEVSDSPTRAYCSDVHAHE